MKNREILEKSELVGCFYCLKIFNPSEIKEWIDDEQTAICPYCGIDSVMAGPPHQALNTEMLQEKHDKEFS